MIVEGLVTTVDGAGRLNIAPMGPIVTGDFESLLLRPFQPSSTFSNLAETRQGVFHVVDEVDVIARAAIGQLDSPSAVELAVVVKGFVLQNCCRWFEFTVDAIDDTDARSRMPCTIVHRGERRPFHGFNRARHAVLEAAILATRVHLLDPAEIESAMRFLQPAVEKTGDESERLSFQMLQSYINRAGRVSR